MDKSLREILSKIDSVNDFAIEYSNVGKQKDKYYGPSLKVGAGVGGYIDYEAQRGLVTVKQNNKKFVTAFNLGIAYSEDFEMTKHLVWKGGVEEDLKAFVESVQKAKEGYREYPYTPEEAWVDRFDVAKELENKRTMQVGFFEDGRVVGSGPEMDGLSYDKFIKKAKNNVSIRTSEQGHWSRSYARSAKDKGAKKSEMERMVVIFKGLEPALTLGHELTVEEFKRYTAAAMDLMKYKTEINVKKEKHEKSEFDKFVGRVYAMMEELNNEKVKQLLNERKELKKVEREEKMEEFVKKVGQLASVLLPGVERFLQNKERAEQKKKKEEAEWERKTEEFNQGRARKSNPARK